MTLGSTAISCGALVMHAPEPTPRGPRIQVTPAAPTALPRILCVDDEPAMLASLAKSLRRQFEVVTAAGGHEGLRALAEDGPFAVITCDFSMPGMSGAEFFAR